eukprot:403335690
MQQQQNFTPQQTLNQGSNQFQQNLMQQINQAQPSQSQGFSQNQSQNASQNVQSTYNLEVYSALPLNQICVNKFGTVMALLSQDNQLQICEKSVIQEKKSFQQKSTMIEDSLLQDQLQQWNAPYLISDRLMKKSNFSDESSLIDVSGLQESSMVIDQQVFGSQAAPSDEQESLKTISQWRGDFADPIFGTLFAYCDSRNRVIIIELDDETKLWKYQQVLRFESQVQDVKFAPRHSEFGLTLAVASLNGRVYIYEGEQFDGDCDFTLVTEIQTNSFGCSVIDWCKEDNENPIFIVGSIDPSLKSDSNFDIQAHKELYLNTRLQIYELKKSCTNYEILAKLRESDNISFSGSITCLKWASLAGRAHHQIAVGTSEGDIMVWKIHIKESQVNTQGTLLEAQCVWNINEGKKPIKLEWDTFGSSLFSTSENGSIKVWKSNIRNEFANVIKFQ